MQRQIEFPVVPCTLFWITDHLIGFIDRLGIVLVAPQIGVHPGLLQQHPVDPFDHLLRSLGIDLQPLVVVHRRPITLAID